jgi:hypothetical protein
MSNTEASALGVRRWIAGFRRRGLAQMSGCPGGKKKGTVPDHTFSRPSLFFWLLAMTLLGGCAQRERLERAVISGTVTYQGQLVKEGEIRFRPLPGTDAPVCRADIFDNKYSITGRGGVPVGKYKVEIIGFRLKKGAPAGHVMNLGVPGGDPWAEQYLPEKFNSKTELEFAIPPGAGKITKDFELQD